MSKSEIGERNLKIVKAYLKAFGQGIPSEMSEYLADDAIFEIPGPEYSAYTKHIVGKKNIHEFYVKRQKTREKFIAHTSVTPNFIVGENSIIAEWTVQGTTTKNSKFESKGTNHFVLNNEGKITSVKIFVNAPLSPDVKSLAEDRLLVADQGRLALMAWAVV